MLLGISGTLGALVAYEGIYCSTFFVVELDAFDFTVLLEVGSELLLSGVLWEVLHVQVASLL